MRALRQPLRPLGVAIDLPRDTTNSIPCWGFLVFLLYTMRPVDCPLCDAVVEQVPWCDGKRTLTNAYMLFLARSVSIKDWAHGR